MNLRFLLVLLCLPAIAQTPKSLLDLVDKASSPYSWVIFDTGEGKGLSSFKKLLIEEGGAEIGIRVVIVQPPGLPELASKLMRAGWTSGTWALLNRSGKILAQGHPFPMDAASVLDVMTTAGVRNPAKELEQFLKTNPDHIQALQALLVVRFKSATSRMEVRADSPPSLKITNREAISNERPSLGPTPLSQEEDQIIWGRCARLLTHLLQGNGPLMGATSIAYSFPRIAGLSPIMCQTAQTLLPAVETRILQEPRNFVTWELWSRMNAIAPRKRSVAAIFEQIPPLPGQSQYLPDSAIITFCNESKAKADWQAIISVIGPIWEIVSDMARMPEVEGSPGAARLVDNVWNQGSPLLEARLRLGHELEAELIVEQMLSCSGQRAVLKRAVSLAKDCGRLDLAKRLTTLEVPRLNQRTVNRFGNKS